MWIIATPRKAEQIGSKPRNFLDMEGVSGSIPLPPTIAKNSPCYCLRFSCFVPHLPFRCGAGLFTWRSSCSTCALSLQRAECDRLFRCSAAPSWRRSNQISHSVERALRQKQRRELLPPFAIHAPRGRVIRQRDMHHERRSQNFLWSSDDRWR